MLPTALIISDGVDVVGLIDTALENEGFAVMTYRDTAEGMRKVYEALPDVVVMEDRLSATESVDFCQRIRQLSCIPVILLGDEGEDLSLVNGFQRGADYYIRRPISVSEFVARVKSLLRRKHGYLDRVRRFLNVEEQSAVLERRSVRLTPTEFRLLAYLTLTRERVVPVRELLLQVWPEQQVTDDSLRFYVSRLRHKLDSGSRHFILNQRGAGYRLARKAEGDARPHKSSGYLTPRFTSAGSVVWTRNR